MTDKTLIKYGDLKLLVDSDCDIQAFIDNKDKIIALNEAVNSFCADLMNQTKEDQMNIDRMKNNLSDFVQLSDVTGYPFDMRDAELYAINNGIDYDVIEIE